MKIVKSILRIAVLLCLGYYAMSYFFNIENDESDLAFFLHFIFDKAFAILLAYTGIRLYTKWSKVDPWIMAYRLKSESDLDKEL